MTEPNSPPSPALLLTLAISRPGITWTEIVHKLDKVDDAGIRAAAAHLGVADVEFRQTYGDLRNVLTDWAHTDSAVGAMSADDACAELARRQIREPKYGQTWARLAKEMRAEVVAGKPWHETAADRHEIADDDHTELRVEVVAHAAGMREMLTTDHNGMMAKLPPGSDEWLAAAKLANLYNERVNGSEPPPEAWQAVQAELAGHAENYGDPEGLDRDEEDEATVEAAFAVHAAAAAAKAAQPAPYSAEHRDVEGDFYTSHTAAALWYAEMHDGDDNPTNRRIRREVEDRIDDARDEEEEACEKRAAYDERARKDILDQVAASGGTHDITEDGLAGDGRQLHTAVREGMVTTGYLDADGNLRTDSAQDHHVLTLTDAGQRERERVAVEQGLEIPDGAGTCPDCGAPVAMLEGDACHRVVADGGDVHWVIRPCPAPGTPGGFQQDVTDAAAQPINDSARCTATEFSTPHTFTYVAAMTTAEARYEFEMCDRAAGDPIHRGGGEPGPDGPEGAPGATTASPGPDTAPAASAYDASTPELFANAMQELANLAMFDVDEATTAEDRHRREIMELEHLMAACREHGLSAEHLAVVIELRNAYAERCAPIVRAREAAASLHDWAGRCVTIARRHLALQGAGAAGPWYQAG